MEHRHLRSVDLSCHHGVHRLSATRLSWPLGIHESLALKSLEQIWNRIKTVSIESIAFSKQKSMFWSILIHFDPFWTWQAQPHHSVNPWRGCSIVGCNPYGCHVTAETCGNNVRRFLPFWSILPFCHETSKSFCHAVPGVHFCLLSCQCGFHWPNSQRNTALAWVSCCFLNIDKQNQKSRNMQKLMNHFKFILNSFILIICDMFFRSFQIFSDILDSQALNLAGDDAWGDPLPSPQHSARRAFKHRFVQIHLLYLTF